MSTLFLSEIMTPTTNSAAAEKCSGAKPFLTFMFYTLKTINNDHDVSCAVLFVIGHLSNCLIVQLSICQNQGGSRKIDIGGANSKKEFLSSSK